VRTQLRDFWPEGKLAEIYPRGYDHTLWGAHVERIDKSRELIDRYAARNRLTTVADLSCGDGALVQGSSHDWWERHLGDFNSGWKYQGRIEKTIWEIPQVDMFVCSETLEHLEDPDAILRRIHKVSRHLFISTPLSETNNANPEHYWGWGARDIAAMLTEAGWKTQQGVMFTPTSDRYYTFQMWLCCRADRPETAKG
jgi:Methyltransferase domain